MSNLGPFRAGGRGAQMLPTPPRGDTIARYPTYLEAQRAVDHLSDNGFPVQFVTIVGTGLRMVERVTGRLTYSIVAVRSLFSGAYFGALVGLFLNLFTNANATVIVAGALFGAGFSVIFGLIAYSLTGGRRDFSSVSQVVATEYEVLCMPEQAGQARQLLSQLPDAGRAMAARARDRARDAGGSSPYGPPPAAPPPYQPPPSGHSSRTTRRRSARSGPRPDRASPARGRSRSSRRCRGPTYGEMMERQRRERAGARGRPAGRPPSGGRPGRGRPRGEGR